MHVRSQILADLQERLEGIEGVGLVVEAAKRHEGDGAAEQLAEGKAVLEWAALDDVQHAEMDGHNVVAFTFEAVVLVHMPEPIPDDQEPHEAAAEWYRKVYLAVQGADQGALAGIALRAELLGGGAVTFSGTGTLCTAAAFEVLYRHNRADPEVPA